MLPYPNSKSSFRFLEVSNALISIIGQKYLLFGSSISNVLNLFIFTPASTIFKFLGVFTLLVEEFSPEIENTT